MDLDTARGRVAELEAEVADLNDWIGHLHDEVITPQQRALQQAVRVLLPGAVAHDLRFAAWLHQEVADWWADTDEAGRRDLERYREEAALNG